MQTRTIVLSNCLIAGFLATTITAPVGALSFDKLTYLTFSGKVQVPGATLDAGTYQFRLANPNTTRNVVQVLTRDGKTSLALVGTLPERRTTLTDEATVTFRETEPGVPPAIKSLFYGGEHDGYEFVYPAAQRKLLGQLTQQPPITYAMITDATEARAAEAPSIAEPAIVAPEEPAVPEGAAPPRAELPQTASLVPLAAVGGLASLTVGITMWASRKYVG